MKSDLGGMRVRGEQWRYRRRGEDWELNRLCGCVGVPNSGRWRMEWNGSGRTHGRTGLLDGLLTGPRLAIHRSVVRRRLD